MFEAFLGNDIEEDKTIETEEEKLAKEEKEKAKKENEERIKQLADKFYKENKNNLVLAVSYLFHGKTKYFLKSSIKEATRR